MDRQSIIERAQDYIDRESDPFFKKQVTDLLSELNRHPHNNAILEDLNDRFYTDLEFGTGGLRGVIGGGYNRLNPYILKRATQGLASYLKTQVPGGQASIVIAFDSRNFSSEFATEAALVLAGNGIKSYLFSSLRPTPELSFAVRYLKTSAGIVITASHNPKEYNGYKVFWNNGAQVLPPHDIGIINEVLNVQGDITSLSKQEALNQGLLEILGSDIDTAFYSMIKGLLLRPDLIKEKRRLRVVYTPLFGAGAIPVSTMLKNMGIEVVFVEEQKNPDGNFPNLKYPNPEEASAMKMALENAKRIRADLVLGTDPDSDRLGIAVPGDGEYQLITGDQLGVLLVDYMISSKKELGTLPKRSAIVKTIVTSELGRVIAGDYGVECYDTLTGFKHISSKINDFEKMKDGPEFLIGYEESYGYLIGTKVRDKDAVTAAAMTCEMALFYQSRGKSILSRLYELYKKYGYYQEVLISKYFKGETGITTMRNFMEGLRTQPPHEFAGQRIDVIKDYKTRKIHDIITGKIENTIDLPVSNVLQFILEDKSIVSVRPSGTEPKIKFYASCRSLPEMEIEKAKKIVGDKIESIEKDINRLIEKMGSV